MQHDEVSEQQRNAEEQQRAQRRGSGKGRQRGPSRNADSRLPLADAGGRPAAGGEKVSFGDLLAQRQSGMS